MGLITGILSVLFKVLTTVISKFVVDEIDAHLPFATSSIIRFATKILPEHRRQQYEAEWNSYISDTPGRLVKLVEALDFVRAALVIYINERTFAVSERTLSELENTYCAGESLVEFMTPKLAAFKVLLDSTERIKAKLAEGRRRIRLASSRIDGLRVAAGDGLAQSLIYAVFVRIRLNKSLTTLTDVAKDVRHDMDETRALVQANWS